MVDEGLTEYRYCEIELFSIFQQSYFNLLQTFIQIEMDNALGFRLLDPKWILLMCDFSIILALAE